MSEDEPVAGQGEAEAIARVAGELEEMGFAPSACLAAAKATVSSGGGTAVAMEWLLAHLDDPVMNDTAEATPPSTAGSEGLTTLTGMGFTIPQAECALAKSGGQVEQAAEWLLGHIESLEDEVAAHERQKAEEPPRVAQEEVEDGLGRYRRCQCVSV